LDHRVYRAAFLPALVALFVLAFSLSDVPKPQTTRKPVLTFDAGRAFGVGKVLPQNSLNELVQAFPDRRPGSPGDTGVADRVAAYFMGSKFTNGEPVKRETVQADTIDGDVPLENVLAVRQGLSSHTVVVLAHRDAVRGPAAAELSGTAVLMELARLLAGRDLPKTVMLASVSGGSGGFAGARAIVDEAPGPVDAVFDLGDMAGTTPRRPFVVPYGSGAPAAPVSLERTAQVAVRAELGQNPGRVRGAVQAIRRVLPLSLSEQGAINDAGAPAVLISNSGERRPAFDEPIALDRFEGFGRSALRAVTAAVDAPAGQPSQRSNGFVLLKRLVPTWAVRLVVLALLLPALFTAFDGFFRARRRGMRIGAWTLWAASFALPFALAWGWARLLDVLGAVQVLPAPAEGLPVLDSAGWISMASVVVIAVGVGFGIRPLMLRGLGRIGDASAGAAAASVGLLLAALTLVVWAFNPYAAAVMLPAAHAWFLIAAPERRPPRLLSIAAVATGLVLPAVVLAYYARAWDTGPWTLFNLISGGALGLGAALTFSMFAALGCATVVILRARRRIVESAPEEPVSTRGPRNYAGPGSLGGTESALRR
jgi:hypothetical protein